MRRARYGLQSMENLGQRHLRLVLQYPRVYRTFGCKDSYGASGMVSLAETGKNRLI